MTAKLQNCKSAPSLLPGILAICVILSGALGATGTSAQLRVIGENGALPGGSTAPGYEDWIDVLAFGQELELVTDEAAGTTAPRLDRFRFLKAVDKASPRLQQAMLGDSVFPRVQLRMRGQSSDDPGRPLLLVEFTQVSFCSIKTTASSGDDGVPVLLEMVAIEFGTISWVYRTPGEDSRTSSWVHDLIYGTGDAARDDDGDGTTNPFDPDDDNDLIPDRAEIMLRMNPLVADSAVDSDGDGTTNEQEYLAGTDVFDAGSRFGVERIMLDVAQETPVASVVVPTIGDRRYRTFASLDGNSWFEVANFVTEADQSPRPRVVELPPAAAGMLSNLMFRVEVDLRPEP